MIVQIAHPNEIILGRWQRVAEVSSLQEAMEQIESPSFEWYEGLCVRVRENNKNIFDGIYVNSHVVNVGPRSDILYVHSWSRNGESSDFLRDYGWIEAWHSSPNPVWMTSGSCRLSSKESICRCGTEMMKSVLSPGFYLDIVNVIANHTSLDEVHEAWNTMPEPFGITDHAVLGISELVRTLVEPVNLSDVAYHAMVLDISREGQLAERNKNLVRIVQNTMPFHEIALKLVK